MGRTTKLDKGVVKRGIVTPDKHFPLHDGPAINVLKKSIEIVKPDFYVDLGDTGEWQSCGSWQWKKKKRPPLEYQLPYIDKEIIEVNKGMDLIDESLDKAKVKERHFCEGNHDDWLNRFVEENPYLDKYLAKTAMKLKERGYEYHINGKYLKIGDMYYYHGNHFAGINHTRNHLLRLGCNVMYGHHHDLQMASVTHIDGPKSAWSIGCLKDMSAEKNTWLGGRQINWAHAFAVVDYFANNQSVVHIIQIVDGVTSLWGELINGND
jgi:hypothetical protein